MATGRENQLDPDVRELLLLVEAADQPAIEDQTPAEARAGMKAAAAMLFPDPVDCDRSDLTAEGPAGPIPVRSYRPSGSAKPLPALVFFHGGGWVLGDLDCYDGLCSRIANDAGICVLSVDYRLSPEYKFPVAVEDCLAALQWIVEHAKRLGVQSDRIAIGGDSAGGNLAAVTALSAREQGRVKLAALLMLYPVTDLNMRHDSYRFNAEGFFLTAGAMRWFRDHYLAEAEQIDDWRASPLLAESLSDLPPTYIATCGFDPVCDEGQAFAARLHESNVPVELHHYDGQIHGFITMGRAIGRASRAIDEICAFLRNCLEG